MRRASSLFIATLTAVFTTVVTMITPAVAASGPSAHVDTRGRGSKPIDTSARLARSRQLTNAEAARWSEPAFVLGDWVPRRFR